jgi:type VI protein secretion system component VasK
MMSFPVFPIPSSAGFLARRIPLQFTHAARLDSAMFASLQRHARRQAISAASCSRGGNRLMENSPAPGSWPVEYFRSASLPQLHFNQASFATIDLRTEPLRGINIATCVGQA